MEVITIQTEAFQELVKQVTANIIKQLQPVITPPREQWLDNQEAILKLHVSKRTMQHYRDSGMLGFSIKGAKIYYKLSDIEEFLESGYKKPFYKKRAA